MPLNINTNLGHIAYRYVKYLDIPVTKTTLINAIQENPFYPSLFSLSDVYSKFRIDNKATTVNAEEIDLVEAPYITILRDTNSKFKYVLVNANRDGIISYWDESSRLKKTSIIEFRRKWQGTVFFALGNEQSGESNYTEVRAKEITEKTRKKTVLFLLISALLSVILFRFASEPALFSIITLAGIKIFGVFISLLLLSYEFNLNDNIVKTICSLSKQTNCDAVLKSNASKLYGISWSEIGLFYFTSTFLFTFFAIYDFTLKVPWLAITSTLASLYIFFSLYYQWKVLKAWCLLCLATQLLLMLELMWGIFNYWQKPYNFNISSLILLVILGLSTVLVYYYFKPILLRAIDDRRNAKSYKRMLNNPDVFFGLLDKQDKIPNSWENLGIEIGNPNAKHTILKVCNPYCGPCSKAHDILEQLLEFNEDVKLKIIFAVKNDDNDRGSITVKHLLSLASNSKNTKEILHVWYSQKKKDYISFAKKFPITKSLFDQNEKVEKMYHWCKSAGISHTPTIYINGRLLPDIYEIRQLKELLSYN